MFYKKIGVLIFIFSFFNFIKPNTNQIDNIDKKLNNHNNNYEFVKQEIEKCNFLQDQLMPQEAIVSYKRKILDIFLKTSVPLCFTIILCKIINYFFITKKYSLKNRKLIMNLLKEYHVFWKNYKTGQENIKSNINILINNFNKDLKKLDHQKFLINSTVFSVVFSISYALLSYLLTEKEKSSYEILLDFIKNWPQNKNKIPTFFHDLFTKYLEEYSATNKISLNTNQAKNFVTDIICQIIDYKSYLRRKIYL
ncbi:hypothetical protein K9L05_01280 [Candidatus Babeliales bacterium]|nr:hypothetical protein [Candidatus Babeliales bacterium]MCF7899263.1 hypothetical protein [Candidatus Babeliales bacterium]